MASSGKDTRTLPPSNLPGAKFPVSECAAGVAILLSGHILGGSWHVWLHMIQRGKGCGLRGCRTLPGNQAPVKQLAADAPFCRRLPCLYAQSPWPCMQEREGHPFPWPPALPTNSHPPLECASPPQKHPQLPSVAAAWHQITLHF